MKYLFSAFLVAAFLTSCSSEVVVDSPVSEDESENEVEIVEANTEPEEKTYLFKSEDEGVTEFMRCTVLEDGDHSWVYFTSKNEKEVELGSRNQAGFEVVYFQAKPKELYWIYGAECGFTLSDDTRKTSQWYGQVSPKCSDDMFE